MRQKWLLAGVLCLLLFLLRYPAESLSAAREGMGLWLNTLIPTLLPFLILTGILLHINGIEKLFLPAASFLKKALGLSPSGGYVFVLGMLCGYPMGAKLASDLYACQKISRREAEYLLTFSCNASPAFLLGYLAQTCLNKTSGGKILIISLLSTFINMFFFRFVVYRGETVTKHPDIPSKKETSQSPQGAIVDVSIMNGFETITRLGGYILLFSLIAALIRHYWPFSALSKHLLLGMTEITTGIYQLSLLPLAYETRCLFAMSLTAFGGMCILAQTKSVLKGQLSILPYLAAKCLSALSSAVLVLFFCLFL